MLKTLRELPDWEMAAGAPDVLGWTVYDSEEHPVGPVVDILIDTAADEVRYVGVQLGTGEEVLLPIGELDMNEDEGALRAVDCDRNDLARLPRFTPPKLSAEIERRYMVLFKREEPVGAWDISPLDYQLPPFKARGSRMERFAHAFAPRRQNPTGPQATPEPGAPRGLGAAVGIFAAHMPWAMEPDAPLQPGPEANPEVLWQAEQPGLGAALGARRELEGDAPRS